MLQFEVMLECLKEKINDSESLHTANEPSGSSEWKAPPGPASATANPEKLKSIVRSMGSSGFKSRYFTLVDCHRQSFSLNPFKPEHR